MDDLIDTLERELADAADGMPPAGDPPAAVIEHARHRRRRHLMGRAALAAVLTVALAVPVTLVTREVARGPVAPVTNGGTADTPTLETRALEMPPGRAAELYHPTIVATEKGFVAWSGLRVSNPANPGSDTIVGVGDHPEAGAGVSFDGRRWTDLPPAPTPAVVGAAGVARGSEVVFVGGARASTTALGTASVVAYEPSTGWRTLEPLPEPVRDATAVAVGDLIVVAVGETPNSFQPGVFIGDGESPWATVDVGHPARGAVSTGAGSVVVYGPSRESDDELVFTTIDVATREARRLPDLTTSGGFFDYAVGPADGASIYAAVPQGDDSRFTLSRLHVGASAWEVVRSYGVLPSDALGSNKWARRADGTIVADGAFRFVLGPSGALVLGPDGNMSEKRVTPRCPSAPAGAYGYAVGKDASGRVQALYWTDVSCSSGAALALLTTG